MMQVIDFFWAFAPNPETKPRVMMVGRGSDGTIWVPAFYLGLGQQALERIRERNEKHLLVNPMDGHIYVESQALIENCKSLAAEKAFMAVKDELLDRLHPSNFRE